MNFRPYFFSGVLILMLGGLTCGAYGADSKKPNPAKKSQNTFVRPVFVRYRADGRTDDYFLYPFGHAYWEFHKRGWECLFNLFHYQCEQEGAHRKSRGTFMPFYFYQKGYGDQDYRAIWPSGGTVRNLFGKERAEWFVWPLYVKTYNQGITRVWRPWPLYTKCSGKMWGMAIYPLGGHFRGKEREERFFLWPLGYKIQSFKEKTLKKGFLPFYAYEETPNIKDESVGWPFFGHRIERQPFYRERRFFWPLLVKGEGAQRSVTRYAPFYTHSEKKKNSYSKTWYLWPFIKEQRWQQEGIDIHQEQAFYFLFWHQEQFEHRTQRFVGSKTHCWPFYSYWDNGQGHKQLQMISPIEPIFQTHPRLHDIYMPAFNLYRYEETPESVQQSFLFNLFKERKTVQTGEVEMNAGFLVDYANTAKKKRFSLLKGLIEYQNVDHEKTIKLLWIPIKSPAKAPKAKAL